MLIAGAAVLWPAKVVAQQQHVSVVGVLRTIRPDMEDFAGLFQRDMAALGWQEGRNIEYVFRYAEGQIDRLPELANELVARKVDIIITFGEAGTRAAQAKAKSLPIVAIADDLLRSGLVVSASHPGGNTTGVSILASELDSKRLELLHEAVPVARRMAVLIDPSVSPTKHAIEAAAQELGLEIILIEARTREELVTAIDLIERAQVEAVNVTASPFLYVFRGQLISAFVRARLPAIYQWPETAQEGGFMSYGPRLMTVFGQVAPFVNKLLKGAKPGDLPIKQPTKFELVINLKTAKALGLSVPDTLLARADEVIE
jgi:putative ABC transport system substrate-binding protein